MDFKEKYTKLCSNLEHSTLNLVEDDGFLYFEVEVKDCVEIATDELLSVFDFEYMEVEYNCSVTTYNTKIEVEYTTDYDMYCNLKNTSDISNKNERILYRIIDDNRDDFERNLTESELNTEIEYDGDNSYSFIDEWDNEFEIEEKYTVNHFYIWINKATLKIKIEID